MKKTKDLVKKKGHLDIEESRSLRRYSVKQKRRVDVLAQEENLAKARSLLIEKSLIEIIMRLETLMRAGETGSSSFSDVSKVHFVNLCLEQQILRKEAKNRLNNRRLSTESAGDVRRKEAASAHPDASHRTLSQENIRGTGGGYFNGVQTGSKYSVSPIN